MQTSCLLSSGSGPKKPRYSQCPPFFWLKIGNYSIEKNNVLLNLEWRKLKRLGELICALNACLDIKRGLTTCFSALVDYLISLRGNATSPSC